MNWNMVYHAEQDVKEKLFRSTNDGQINFEWMLKIHKQCTGFNLASNKDRK